MTTFLTARRYLGFVSLILSLLTLSAPSAMATHLRGGTLTWTVVNSGDPSQFIVQFTFQYSQRWSYPNSPGVCSAGSACPALNTTIDLSTLSGGGLFAPGDGTFLDPTGTITAVNQAEDWCDATFVFNYVYSTSQSQYTAYFYDASRISTLQINANANEYIGTTVSNYAGGAPVASIPSMVAVPIGPVIVNLAPFVADIDPNAYLYFRLSTLDEMLGPGSSAVLCPDGMTLYQLNGVSLWQPPGLAISTSGRMTWDISQIQQASCGFAFPQAGDLWATQIIVEALDSSANLLSETPIDFILKFELPNGSLPTITLNPAGPQTVKTGTPVSFTATANSSNPLAKVTLNAVGVPAGASATNLNTALTPPQSSTFSWTPSQAGTYVVAYTVTDNNFQQASASETIIVAAAPPTISCSSPISVQYGQSGTLSASVFDPNNQLLSVVWSVDGSTAQTNDGVKAYPTAATVNLNQNFGAVGTHTVTAKATDPMGVPVSCSTSANVTQASQTITFGALPNLVYGAADFLLTATASSGDPVSYTATGNCTVTGGTVHITGAGSCSIDASQAGDSNYTAATDVIQSFNIGTAPVTATAGGGSFPYNGSPQSPSACMVTGPYTGDLSCTNNPASVGPNVGTTSITPVVSGTGLTNYTITPVNGSATISQSVSTVTVNCSPGSVYSGSALTPCTATVTSGGGFSQALTVSYGNNTNAGTASASASFAGDTDHAANSGSTTFTIGVAPSAVTVTCPSSVLVTGSPLTPCSANVTGAGGLNSPLTVAYMNNSAPGLATASASYAGDANHSASSNSASFTIAAQSPSVTTLTCPASVTYTGSPVTPCTANVTGANGLNQSVTVTYSNNIVGTATATASFAGDSLHTGSSATKTFSILYSTGACLGSAGHTILQPINADGSSVWKQGSTVPAKFRVCDAYGNSVSSTVVKSFYLYEVIAGTVVTQPDETPVSTTPDVAFRWSPSPDSLWIFNISTSNLSANTTYVYQITLLDGSVIQFQFGLR